MADLKISQLPVFTSAVPATDAFAVVSGGTTKQITTNQILLSGGTATLASATITGDLTVDTSTLKVDSTNNRVGIGTATPADTLDVNGRITALRYLSSSSNAALPSFAVSAGNGAYSSGANEIGFAINSANAMTLNSTGNLAFPTGKGIDFSAVTGGTGTATANVLNDYEEGTWTGTMTGSTTNPTVPVTATGKYTKIGRQVTVVIYFTNVSTVGASGGVAITGLPFTEDGTRAVGTAGFYNFDFNGGTGPFVDISGSTLGFSTQLTNAVWRDINHSAGLARYLRATVTYFV